MSDAMDNRSPTMGLYEQLITLRLEDRLKELEGTGWRVINAEVGTSSTPHVLARHVADVVLRVLSGLPASERVQAANHILESVNTLSGAQEWADMVAEGPRQLMAVAQQQTPGVYAIRPATPLSDTALLTNAPEDPNLGFELRAELVTADRVDLLCAFVKWHGLRIIEGALSHGSRSGGAYSCHHDHLYRSHRATCAGSTCPGIRCPGKGELRAAIDATAREGLALS